MVGFGMNLIEELDLLWRVRFGQPLPVIADPAVIIRVMRMIEEKKLARDGGGPARAA